MKNYYQQKKGGWSLEPVIYAKTVKQIRCYRFFRRILEAEDAGAASEGADAASQFASAEVEGAGAALNSAEIAAARQYVDAIEQALELYVPSEYREAVFAHMVDGAEYLDLEERFFVSASTMKRYAQVFVWGVATELGETFSG